MRGKDYTAVADDLRSPALRIPLAPRGRLGLRVIRSLPTPERGLRRSVPVATVQVPGEGGGPVRVLCYERADRARPGAALVWLHGGGFTFGTPEQCHALCSRWADELGLLVLSVGYRLAPEHPFPAGLDDAYAVLRWAAGEAGTLGIRADRIAVGGESGGGGMAAALCQLARDRQGPAVCFQLLEYPMLDDRTVLRAGHDGRGQFVWTPANNRFAWTCYLGGAPEQHDDRRYAAPARAADLRGLPPAWIGVGGLDLFHDEDTAYARRLAEAGVACGLHVQPRMYHGADSVVPGAGTSLAFRDRMTQALAQGLGTDPLPNH
jgi:acetyl esterase/lipase